MADGETSVRDENKEQTTEEEYRVEVQSKKKVKELIEQCKEVLKTALDGQADVKEDTKTELVQHLLAVGLFIHLLHLTLRLKVYIFMRVYDPYRPRSWIKSHFYLQFRFIQSLVSAELLITGL